MILSFKNKNQQEQSNDNTSSINYSSKKDK